MKINTKIRIQILPSRELDNIGLTQLGGIIGTVVQAMYKKDGSLHGAWVKLPMLWQGEKEWFIPEVSLSIV